MVIESIDGAIKSSNRITLFIPSIECAIKCQSMIDWWLAWCVMWKVRVGINNFGTSYCYHLTVVLLDATFSKKHTKKRTISLKVHSNMKVMKVMKGWRWFNQSMTQSNHQIESWCLYHRLNVPSNQQIKSRCWCYRWNFYSIELSLCQTTPSSTTYAQHAKCLLHTWTAPKGLR